MISLLFSMLISPKISSLHYMWEQISQQRKWVSCSTTNTQFSTAWLTRAVPHLNWGWTLQTGKGTQPLPSMTNFQLVMRTVPTPSPCRGTSLPVQMETRLGTTIDRGSAHLTETMMQVVATVLCTTMDLGGTMVATSASWLASTTQVEDQGLHHHMVLTGTHTWSHPSIPYVLLRWRSDQEECRRWSSQTEY